MALRHRTDEPVKQVKKFSHNPENGHPTGTRVNDARSKRLESGDVKLQVDRAVALAEVELGVGGGVVTGGGLVSAPVGAASTVLPTTRGDWSGIGAGPVAPLRPVPGPAHAWSGISAARGEFESTFGVSGTPITSGFLVDLGEYNAELMGRNAISTYEKMRRSDAQVRATLAACKLPVLSAKWEIVPADGAGDGDTGTGRRASTGAGKATAAKAKQIATFVKDNLFGALEFRSSTGGWVSQSWQSVIANALLMLDFGCAVHEDVWSVDGDRIRVRCLPSRLPLTFYRWHTEADGETLLALEQYGYRGNEFLNALLPADKLCRFTHQQEGANFWGIALQRAMYPHWYVKSKLYRIDAIANERNALGIPVFRLAEGFGAEDKAAAYGFVTQLAAHEATGLVEPPGEPHTGLRVVGYQGNLRDIMPSIQHHNEMISRAALNTFIDLGQSSHGSRALGATATDFFMLGLQSVADQIAIDLTHSTIRRLVAMNFGSEAPCPRLIPANVQARSAGELIADLTALAQQGLIVSEKNIRRAIRERFALPEESQEGVVAVRGETVEQGGRMIAGRGSGEIEQEDDGAGA
ncbi:MAG: phage portal protein family protein [Terriglobia bacterium]